MTTHSNLDDWKKELRVLLDQVQSHPSSDLAAVRDRIVVLNRLIAGKQEEVAA